AKKNLGKDLRDPTYMKALLELVHTTKGACGFLPLPRLERVASSFTAVVDDIYAGNIVPSSGIMMLIMGVLDRFGDLLDAVRETGVEPAGDDTVLIRGLERIRARTAEQPTATPEPSPLPPAQQPEPSPPPAPPPPPEPEPEAVAGAGFTVFRLGDVCKAIDLVHVEWLDLSETLAMDDRGGGIVVASYDEAIQLAPHDEVTSRNPSGPWPLIVLGKDGRRMGLIVEEVLDVVEELEPDVELMEPDAIFAT
ncbi:MAG: hypothetical protein H8E94_04830, partial [Alphaproteobacteria bacterium]|nr:hypothetical protein [Alphaproteobacteria bacterium]